MTGVRARTAIVSLLLAAAVAVEGLSPAGAAQTSPPRIPYPSTFTQPPVGLDEATRKAAELQQQAEDLQAESVAIDGRIRVTTKGIYEQSIVVEAAQATEASAQARFDERVIGMYKTGATTPLELILTAPTFRDAIDRGIFLMTLVERDQELLHDATRVSSDAAYQAQVLDQMRAQQVALRRAQDERALEMRSALVEQQQLVAQLNDQQRKYLAEKAAWDASQRDAWRNSSYYASDVPKVPATVVGDPHPYLVDDGEPLVYRTRDTPKTLVCSWYGNADNAPTPTSTASGRAFNENEFTCASRTLAFGTRLALTYGDNHIIVVVTDRGPYVDGRDLDLSKAAAHMLGFDGVQPVTAQTVVAQ